MSLVWMQYEDPMAQRPPLHSPEQHSALDEHVLFAVTHEGFVAMALQVPPEQLPVQHALPATGHAVPMLKHCVVPQ
jgi:hypothetical protein